MSSLVRGQPPHSANQKSEFIDLRSHLAGWFPSPDPTHTTLVRGEVPGGGVMATGSRLGGGQAGLGGCNHEGRILSLERTETQQKRVSPFWPVSVSDVTAAREDCFEGLLTLWPVSPLVSVREPVQAEAGSHSPRRQTPRSRWQPPSQAGRSGGPHAKALGGLGIGIHLLPQCGVFGTPGQPLNPSSTLWL